MARRLLKDNKRAKQINKPGSVSPATRAGDDDHSSGTYVTACLKRPNPEASGEQPLSRSPPSGRKWESLSIWSCSGWGLPSSRRHHRDWCALTTPFHPYQGAPYSGLPFPTCTWRSIFCGTFLRVTPTGRYPAPCSTEPGLSSPRPEGEERSSCAKLLPPKVPDSTPLVRRPPALRVVSTDGFVLGAPSRVREYQP
jgi:hypothetical protein